MATCKDCFHYEACKGTYYEVKEQGEFDGEMYAECGCDDFKSVADVEEVKHGEWIQEWELEKGLEDNDEIPYIKCSLCGHMEWGIDKEMDITPNYCNECGAKMDGGKEE